jgi:hypothetical protein
VEPHNPGVITSPNRILFGRIFRLVSSQLRIKSGFPLPESSHISARKLALTWGLGGESLLK